MTAAQRIFDRPRVIAFGPLSALRTWRRQGFAALVSVVAMLTAASARAQPPSVEAIVAKAEPGVACIVVSRSEWYRKLDLVDGSEPPGKLGGFDINRVDERKMGLQLGDTKFQVAQVHLAYSIKLDLAHVRNIPESFGSGIVVDGKGLILTNYHVVQDATKVFVRLPGGKGSYADIWAADPRSDLAVLKVQNEGILPLTPIPMGNADTVRRGQQVIALANPYSAGQHDGHPSVSVGVISNLRRRVPGRQPMTETNANPLYQFGILMQTDARIALGSSGGALLNMEGECIGITSSLAALAGSDAPGGFALPVNAGVRKIIDVLKKGEEVEYGYLGVSLQEHQFAQEGAAIGEAQFGAPAQREADLQPRDVIVAIGQYPVRDTQDLFLSLGLFLAGERTTLGIRRAETGKIQKVNVTLVKYDVNDNLGKRIASSLGNRPYVGGLRVDYTSLLAQRARPLGSVLPGVLVVEVQKDSKAERLNILTNDIITHVAGVPVSTPAAFYEQLARQAGPTELTIRRENRKIRW